MGHMGMTRKLWSIPDVFSVFSINEVTQISIELSLCVPKAEP